MVARIRTASIMAKWLPMQILGPSLNRKFATAGQSPDQVVVPSLRPEVFGSSNQRASR